MPNCFQLIDKVTKEPVILAKLDDDLRVHFKQPPDESKYLWFWYDVIGFKLAMGESYEDIRNGFKQSMQERPNLAAEYQDLMDVLAYIEERYDPNTWVEIGRRR